MTTTRALSTSRFKLRWNSWDIITIIAFIFIILFMVYPLFNIFLNSFFYEGSFNFSHYKDFFTLKYYYSSLTNSLLVCGLATIFAICIGFPMAYILTRFDLPFKKIIHILIILTLLSPPFIGAYSWILILGNNGFLTNFLHSIGLNTPSIYGLHGMIWVFTVQFYPHIYLYVSGALKTMDSSLEEASESLGSNKLRKLRTVTLPLIFPTLSTGALMVFMASFADFGTPMLLGQGIKLLPILAYEQFINEMGSNPAMASTLSMILLSVSTGILFLQRYLVTRKSYSMSSMRPPKVIKLKPLQKFFAMLFVWLVLAVSLIPQITVITTSFLKTNGPVFTNQFSLDSYREVLFRVPQAIINTFSYSALAIVFMVVAGLLLSYIVVRRSSKISALLDTLIMIPYVIPGTVLGISFIVAFNKPPIEITGTWIILVIAYSIRKLPYTMRSSTAILYQIDRSVEEASISLGVPPMKTFFKTTAILMLPGVLSGAILSWVTTINELSSTIVLYTGATSTITVAIYSQVFTSSYGTAAALASILSLSTIASLIIVTIISGKKGIPI
ncbi:iron ABC transporter permease [Peribacillus psychrosaccharolyticus]|uniref:Iron ABC transporter permease n=1 Tax=Peribacillus psychrosaccharolyticus TaxID=1407 RepID=A0A974NLX6_PERPY|nr:iron ABC transporter permease [Peribacillus psychrosaccharolyticus]MEC2056802.1 iron ABC transporter permease [Peribacillus psychrosaccharolyticus]MED3746256.1 iron ABC transporter permease [Peribacillus psychrosaccharolyticus]QQT00075.1 iron ABC transporter permease [Peribacillus psychrosaccharolyticus]